MILLMITCCEYTWIDWITSINPFQILIAAIVGIATGYVASKIFATQSKKIEQKKLQKIYKPLAGRFIRWWLEDKQEGGERIFATADIEYLIENKLSIEVRTLINYGNAYSYGDDFAEDKIERWTGEIVMDTIRSGTIVWEQRNPDNGNNGFKRIIISKDMNEVTLIGESDKGFGIERFTERESMG